MSNNYQNNYFPDDSDPAGQAEYFALVTTKIVFLTRILIIPKQKYWNSFDIYQNVSVYTPAKPL